MILKFFPYLKKQLFPILVVILTLLSQSINLFHYPEFLGDEGIYTAQGWWLVRFGQISPYTYWYDHTPFGWIQIGLWQLLTGGPFTFGFSLHSTRILMVLFTTAANLLLFLILKKITQSKYWALLGSLVFALSPLSLIYHRQVLLDNIATFWFLFAFYFLLIAKKRLPFFLLAGIFLGFSILSKETMVVFFLPLLFLAHHLSQGKTHLFSLAVFLISVFFIVSLYPLLAYLKLELLPASWLPDQRQHVSLIEALLFQSQRGGGGNVFHPQSDIRQAINDWLRIDPFLVVSGSWASFILLLKKKRAINFTLFLANLFFALFLLRGGVVLGFYIIPQIALWSLSLPLAFKEIFQSLKIKTKNILWWPAFIFLAVFLALRAWPAYTQKENVNQMAGIDYLRQHISPQAVVAVDPFAWIDLKLDHRYPTFAKAEWFSKIENDPQIREGKLGGRWQKIDYLYLTRGAQDEIEKNHYQFIEEALAHGQIKARFNQKNGGGEASLYEIPEEEKLTPLGKIIETKQKEVNLTEKIRSLIIAPDFHYGGYLINHSQQVAQIPLANTKPVFIDQEGGKVSRLPEIPNIAQAEIKDKNEAFRLGKARGILLKREGITVNLAPVLDIAFQPQSFIARDQRSFGNDPQKVTALGKAMIDGFHEAGIKCVIKHFPGSLGRTLVDPHYQMPVVNINLEELEKDFAPFAAAANRADGVLVTHILYPQIDPRLPASLSPIFINALLRQRLGFQGPVILDDLNMKAISQKYSQEEAIKLGLVAGADMFIIQQPEEELVNKIKTMVDKGKLDAALINRAYERAQKFILRQ